MANLNLSKEETITLHRKMWAWIADETLKRNKPVPKEEYFSEHNIGDDDIPFNQCYCCDFTLSSPKRDLEWVNCMACPLIWGKTETSTCIILEKDKRSGAYYRWYTEKRSPKISSYLARIIANLPEREDDKNEQ